jgi:hypothetical protein
VAAGRLGGGGGAGGGPGGARSGPQRGRAGQAAEQAQQQRRDDGGGVRLVLPQRRLLQARQPGVAGTQLGLQLVGGAGGRLPWGPGLLAGGWLLGAALAAAPAGVEGLGG